MQNLASEWSVIVYKRLRTAAIRRRWPPNDPSPVKSHPVWTQL